MRGQLCHVILDCIGEPRRFFLVGGIRYSFGFSFSSCLVQRAAGGVGFGVFRGYPLFRVELLQVYIQVLIRGVTDSTQLYRLWRDRFNANNFGNPQLFCG